jgi:hypothetical protein
MRRRLLAAVAVLTVTSLAVMGCGGGGGGTGGGGSSNIWVGRVDGTDAFIAMLIQETARLVYVTDGKELSLLFRGKIGETGDTYFTLRDEDNHVLNMKAPQNNRYTGLISIGQGQHLNFTMVRAQGEAGLYRAKETVDGATWQNFWIVLADGQVRGARVNDSGQIQNLATLGGVKWTDPSTDP